MVIDKEQQKLFLDPVSREILRRNKRLRGESYSVAVDKLIQEVLDPELDALVDEAITQTEQEGRT